MAVSAARCAIIGAALTLASACRNFDECGPGIAPCPSPSGLQCEPGKDSCDGSTLNGCETDLASSVLHCGACGQPCSGVCSNGSCVPFEIAVADRLNPRGNVAITGDYVYYAAERRGGALTLERLTRADGTVTGLASGAWSEISAIAASPTRLYVLGDERLGSLPLGGGELKDEGVSPGGVVTIGPHVALTSLDGAALSIRRGDVGDFVAIPGIDNAELVAAGTRSLAVAQYVAPTIEDYGYEIWLHDLDSGTTTQLASVTGAVRGIAVDDEYDDNYMVYYSVDLDPSVEESTFYAVGEGLEPSELMTLADVTRWVIAYDLPAPFFDAPAIVSSFSKGGETGLRFASIESPIYQAEWPTRGDVQLLAATGPILYFFDEIQAALVEVDLDDMLTPRLTQTSDR